MIATMFDALAANRTAWRRARNLRAGSPAGRAAPQRAPMAASAAVPDGGANRTGVRAPAARGPAPLRWAAAAAVLLGLGGAWAIASHARLLGASSGAAGAEVAALQPALPGAAFTVPAQPGVTLEQHGGGALLVAAGMRAEAPLHIDLCSQLPGPGAGRLLPLRVGYQFTDVARWVARNEAGAGPATLRNIVLAAPAAAMPRIEIGGSATPGRPLQLRWNGPDGTVRWIGDASAGAVAQGAQGQAAFQEKGWLVWGAGSALHVTRRPSPACAQAGQLTLQLYRTAPGTAGRALVAAFPARSAPVELALSPGAYVVPKAPPARLEDRDLFEQLRSRALARLGANGLVELAPRDLAAWQAAPGSIRARTLAGWDAVRLDDTARGLIERLYHRADGDYVREQVRIFNGERRLLAWRIRAADAQGSWRASVGGAPVSIADTMPLAAARLFAQVPQGWVPWQRVADWPEAGAGPAGRLVLTLPQTAGNGATLQVMLVGRVKSISGARLRAPAHAICSGRACPAADAAQLLELELTPGTRSVEIEAAPLDMDGLAAPGDGQYRHLRVAGGVLEWQPVASQPRGGRPLALAEVRLADRNGAPLWGNGATGASATAAGLAPLLGLRAGHTNSVAGMLARLPSPTGAPHAARLSLDLALQTAASGALDCVGMRRGSWDGQACSGGSAPPQGRQAGIVVIDTGSGEILAAAGAGNPEVDARNWNEVRDFDRVDPARSPLRLPALQHDGGAHRAPGSTFKVVSALGLELAAQHDRRLDALLAGQPLDAINRIARDGGFAFRTDAATYPSATTLAHITNYREQQLDRRAQDGRLGLAQALTYSLNTWFAWTAELSDRSLFGRPAGGAPGLHGLEAGALAGVRPIAGMAQRLGFERALRLDGGLLPPDYAWSRWDALQASAAHIDPIATRHELRQMAIGLRMQATPLQMALVAGAVGQGRIVAPRLLLELDGRKAAAEPGPALGVRLDRIRAGMKGVVDTGTAAGAFRGEQLAGVRRGLYGKTGTAPAGVDGRATVWFTGWLEPGSLPGQTRRLAFAAFVSHSEASGGEHAAPVVAALLRSPQLMRAATQ
jgi:hypothetical protein